MYSSKIIAKTIYGLIADDGMRAEEASDKLLAFLTRYHILSLAPRIIEYLEIENARAKRSSMLSITTASRVDGNIVEDIKRYMRVPQQTQAETSEDPGLIGGFEARWRGEVYDASIKRQLADLKAALIS